MTETSEDGICIGKLLQQFIERIECLEEERAGLANDVSDLYNQAKSNGYNIRAMRAVIKLRKMQEYDRDQMENMIHLYQQELGML